MATQQTMEQMSRRTLNNKVYILAAWKLSDIVLYGVTDALRQKGYEALMVLKTEDYNPDYLKRADKILFVSSEDSSNAYRNIYHIEYENEPFLEQIERLEKEALICNYDRKNGKFSTYYASVTNYSICMAKPVHSLRPFNEVDLRQYPLTAQEGFNPIYQNGYIVGIDPYERDFSSFDTSYKNLCEGLDSKIRTYAVANPSSTTNPCIISLKSKSNSTLLLFKKHKAKK